MMSCKTKREGLKTRNNMILAIIMLSLGMLITLAAAIISGLGEDWVRFGVSLTVFVLLFFDLFGVLIGWKMNVFSDKMAVICRMEKDKSKSKDLIIVITMLPGLVATLIGAILSGLRQEWFRFGLFLAGILIVQVTFFGSLALSRLKSLSDQLTKTGRVVE